MKAIIILVIVAALAVVFVMHPWGFLEVGGGIGLVIGTMVLFAVAILAYSAFLDDLSPNGKMAQTVALYPLLFAVFGFIHYKPYFDNKKAVENARARIQILLLECPAKTLLLAKIEHPTETDPAPPFCPALPTQAAVKQAVSDAEAAFAQQNAKK